MILIDMKDLKALNVVMKLILGNFETPNISSRSSRQMERSFE